ncbi:dnaJ homolog subfamily C member 18-like isoform X2 [Pecten maximus]|uniref:dnaJ homolog subfamily C member 18-like isoform X2 n=1 Tax=Pecten maximus TaxID=6579 RepID=UPI001458800F|nr:dnaJ homolog subfamily C member 18-like isoform X2 [Pecten maximus]
MRIYNGAATLLARHCRSWQYYCGFKTRSSSCYYETLGIKKSATQQEIKSAYIQLSKKHHPDVSTHANAQMQFTKVSEAYQVLGNPKSRKSYDNSYVSNSSLFTKAHRPNTSFWEEFDSRSTYYSNISEEEYFDVRRGIKFKPEDEETITTPYRMFMDMLTVMTLLTVVIVVIARHKESINNNIILPPSSHIEDIDENKNNVSRERAKQLKYLNTVQHSEDMELDNQ